MANPSVQSVSGPTRYSIPAFPISHAHTCGGNNRVLYVAVTHDQSGVVSGVTYNSATMDLVAEAIDGTNGYGTRVYRLIAPPSGQSYNVQVGWSVYPGAQAFVTAVCVQDAAQSAPDRTPQTVAGNLGSPQTVNVTSVAGDFVLSFAGVGSSFTGSSLTYLSGSPNNNSGSNWHDNAAASGDAATGTSTTAGYTLNAQDGFSLVAFAVKAATALAQSAFRWRNDDGGV